MPDQKMDHKTEHSLVEALRSILSWQALVGAIKGIKYETKSSMGRTAAEDRGEAPSRADMPAHSLEDSWKSAMAMIDSAVRHGVAGAEGAPEVDPVDPPTLEEVRRQLNGRLRFVRGLTPERKSDLIGEFGYWFAEKYGKLFKTYRSSGNSLDRVDDPLLGKTRGAKVAVKLFAHDGSTLAGARTTPSKGGDQAGSEETTNKQKRALQTQNDEVWRHIVGALKDHGTVSGMVIDIQANIDAPAIQAGGIKGAHYGGHFLVTHINGVEVYKKPEGLDLFRDRTEFLKATPFIFTYSTSRTRLADGSMSTERHLPVGTPVKVEASEGLAMAGASADFTEDTPKSLTFLLPEGVSEVAEGQRHIGESEWPKFLEFSSRIFENKVKTEQRSTSYISELGGGSGEDGEEDKDADEFSTDILESDSSGYMHSKGDQYDTQVREKFRKDRDGRVLRDEQRNLANPARSLHQGISDRLNRFNNIIHGKKDELESELLENVKKILSGKTGVDSIVSRSLDAGSDLPTVLSEVMASKEVMSQFTSQLTESVLTFARIDVPYSVAKAQEKYLESLRKGPQALENVSPQDLQAVLDSFTKGVPDSRLYDLVKGKAMAAVSTSQFDSKVGPVLYANMWSTLADLLAKQGERGLLHRLVTEIPSWGSPSSQIGQLHARLASQGDSMNTRVASREVVNILSGNKPLGKKLLDALTRNLREVVLDAVSEIDVSVLDKIQEDLASISGGSITGAGEMSAFEAQQHLSQAGHASRSDGSKFYGMPDKHASDSEIMAIRMASKKMKGGL